MVTLAGPSTVMNEKNVSMELDTGAALSILSETTWKRLFPMQNVNSLAAARRSCAPGSEPVYYNFTP